MSNQYPVASVVSASNAINGNTDNSSQNFKFLPDTSNYTYGQIIVAINGNDSSNNQAKFNLWKSETGKDHPVIKNLKQGSSFSATYVNSNDTYYIGDPTNDHPSNFVVTFSLNPNA